MRLHRLGDPTELEKSWGAGVVSGWRSRIARWNRDL